MVRNIKEYLLKAKTIRNLEIEKNNTDNLKKVLKINAEIRRLELEIFDFNYAIKNYLDYDERKYIELKYLENYNNVALQFIFNKPRTTLYNYENNILAKLNSGK